MEGKLYALADSHPFSRVHDWLLGLAGSQKALSDDTIFGIICLIGTFLAICGATWFCLQDQDP